MNIEKVPFSSLAYGELFKIDGVHHIQVKRNPDDIICKKPNPYHSAEHRCVVIMSAEPDMLVTPLKNNQ